MVHGYNKEPAPQNFKEIKRISFRGFDSQQDLFSTVIENCGTCV
jgi:hypothetical protein